jgi:hypothetical protein
MNEQQQLENIKRALDMARNVIRSYEMDIRNAVDIVGVDLVELGFCQGEIYTNALTMIARIEKGEFRP